MSIQGLRVHTVEDMETSPKTVFPFTKLPAELRNKIYRYLLSPEYTMVDPKRSRHYLRLTPGASAHFMGIDSLSQAELTRFHDHRYHTQILRTGKEISGEASSVFFRQNLFVTFRCSYPGFLIEKIENNLLPLVAKDHRASRFARHTTVITLRPWWYSKVAPVPVILTFLGEYLPAFVTMLLAYERTLSSLLGETALAISVNENLNLQSVIRGTSDEATLPARTMSKILEPLRGLHSVRSLQITGPVNDRCSAHLTAEITKRRPTAGQMFTELCSSVHDANKTSKSGEYSLAMSKYKAAIGHLWRIDILKPEETTTIASAGEYAGLPLDLIRGSVCFRIASGLADMYLRLQDFGEAHHWACVALGPFKNLRFRRAIHLGDVSLTSVYMMAAKASEGCGLLLRACSELERCLRRDAGNRVVLEERSKLKALCRSS